MSITDRTRKILWGRSGNLCAYCRRVLVEDRDELSDESVVGCQWALQNQPLMGASKQPGLMGGFSSTIRL